MWSVSDVATTELCAAKCTEQRDHCQWYTFDAGNTDRACKIYSGTCTGGGAGTSATAANTYKKMQMCYWTAPLLVHTDSDCVNGAELNGGGANTINQYPMLVADVKRSF
jgi:hypothetical protein